MTHLPLVYKRREWVKGTCLVIGDSLTSGIQEKRMGKGYVFGYRCLTYLWYTREENGKKVRVWL